MPHPAEALQRQRADLQEVLSARRAMLAKSQWNSTSGGEFRRMVQLGRAWASCGSIKVTPEEWASAQLQERVERDRKLLAEVESKITDIDAQIEALLAPTLAIAAE